MVPTLTLICHSFWMFFRYRDIYIYGIYLYMVYTYIWYHKSSTILCPFWHQLYFAFYSTFIWMFFFRGRFWNFFWGFMVLCFRVSLIFCLSASLLLCFSAFLLLCFSVFCFPCFSAFPASQLFVFPASLLFLLLCFSASLFSLLLCFLASYFYFPCVFHFPLLDSILSVSQLKPWKHPRWNLKKTKKTWLETLHEPPKWTWKRYNWTSKKP